MQKIIIDFLNKNKEIIKTKIYFCVSTATVLYDSFLSLLSILREQYEYQLLLVFLSLFSI